MDTCFDGQCTDVLMEVCVYNEALCVVVGRTSLPSTSPWTRLRLTDLHTTASLHKSWCEEILRVW